jgi:hypothetical protein
MGRPSDKLENYSYDNALQKYPDILLLHIADQMSSTLYEHIIK